MLNGDDNENGFKTKRSNQQKKEIASAAHFFFQLAKRKFARAARFFVFSLAVVLHD